MYKPILNIGCVLLLSACSLAPVYQQPTSVFPDSYQSISAPMPENVKHIEPRWWVSYNDPVLNELIEQALSYNYDLAGAIARMDDAAAQAKIARNAMLPSIAGSAAGGRQNTSEYSASGDSTFNSYTVGATLSWELDIWGRLRNANKSAKALFLASAYNVEAMRLSLAAQVAATYFQLLAADSALKLAQETERSRQETFELQSKGYQAGNLSMLEVEQARAEWATSQLSLTQNQLAVKTTETALSVLTGQQPREFLQEQPRGLTLTQLTIPVEIPVGLPSDILLRRPDLAAAEQNLIAANANIGVARSAYFPRIGLTSSVGAQSLEISKLFTGPALTWSFLGDLAAPIFNFGTTQANVASASARQRLALATYQKAVQTSFQDTLDSLRQTENLREQVQYQKKQTTASKEALRLVNLRYENGYSAYLDVLDAQRQAYAVQQQDINTQLNYLNATVNLYKALGGGWRIQD